MCPWIMINLFSLPRFVRYSANFAFRHGSDPPNSGYHMNLQQARFPLSKAFAQRLEARYTDEDSIKV